MSDSSDSGRNGTTQWDGGGPAARHPPWDHANDERFELACFAIRARLFAIRSRLFAIRARLFCDSSSLITRLMSEPEADRAAAGEEPPRAIGRKR